MKTRNGFVSNSSSSSFLVVGERPGNCNSARLTEEQIEKVIDFLAEEKEKYSISPTVVVERQPGEPVYLTEYFSDGCESECVPEWDRLCDEGRVYCYEDGNHGRPYGDYETHTKIRDANNEWNMGTIIPVGDAVWLRKEHS